MAWTHSTAEAAQAPGHGLSGEHRKSDFRAQDTSRQGSRHSSTREHARGLEATLGSPANTQGTDMEGAGPEVCWCTRSRPTA